MRWCIVIACLFAAGCSSSFISDIGYVSSGIDTITAVETNRSDNSASVISCYRWTQDGDTGLLRLSILNSNVRGTLAFNYAKKESTYGSIKGVIKDSLINVNYTYKQNGKTIERETIFKIAGDALVKASGELKISGQKIRYANKTGLVFSDDRSFDKVDCSN